MVNDETRRKLRLLNIGEFVEELANSGSSDHAFR